MRLVCQSFNLFIDYDQYFFFFFCFFIIFFFKSVIFILVYYIKINFNDEYFEFYKFYPLSRYR